MELFYLLTLCCFIREARAEGAFARTFAGRKAAGAGAGSVRLSCCVPFRMLSKE